MNRLLSIIFSSISVILLQSCTAINIIESPPTSTVSISAASKSLGGAGSGIIIYIKNQDTGETLKSQSFGRMSNHSVILEVPPGNYTVSGVELPIGGLIFKNYGPEVNNYFGIIKVESGKRYYLGFHRGVQKIGLRNIVALTQESTDIPVKLEQKFMSSELSDKSRGFEVIALQDTSLLMIY